MYMRTKRIIAKCEQHSGYGAGAGDTEYYEYECPCGKGTIIEEHDNIPGFREHSVYLHCTTCSKEYIIDTSAGTRNWKIVRKKVNRMKTQPYICRVHIENFRNFHSADFSLGEKQVLIGENAVGKSNLLYALQLILDPTLSEKDRMLEESDFWDGIENPMDKNESYVRKALEAKYPWIIVDEYQDLGKPLHELILTLLNLTRIKVFAVGDADQSIYDFQGAAPDYLIELSQRQDVSCIHLKNNYRSSQTIVDASEYVLKSSRGYIASGKLRDYHAKLEFIECSKGMDEQYERVIEQISRFHTEGIPYHEIAVLVGNNKQVTELAQECSRQNIPAYIARQTFRLTDLIIWIQNCAKWVSDKCSVSFDEICSTWKSFISQKRIISEDDYFLLKRTIFQTLTVSKVYKDNLSEWLCYLDKKVGIVSAFTASERYPDEIDNYNKLIETARSHDTQLTIKFLTRLGIPENQVVLTTRHSSKGLEFDVVILPGMEKDSFPSYYDNTPRKLAEARRLCFVSVSRARKACILIRSKNLQNQYGRWFSKEPSPFWVALQEFQDSRSDY